MDEKANEKVFVIALLGSGKNVAIKLVFLETVLEMRLELTVSKAFA